MSQILVYTLKATGRYGYSARTHKLQHAILSTQVIVKICYIIAHACHLYNREHRIHLYDMGTVTTYYLRRFWRCLKLGS